MDHLGLLQGLLFYFFLYTHNAFASGTHTRCHLVRKVLGSRSGGYEEFYLLGYYVV
jgi:hypothetical protein